MKRLLQVLYLCLLFPVSAHAYADPGSGLMLWQLVVSFFFGLMFFFKRFAGAVARFLKKDE